MRNALGEVALIGSRAPCRSRKDTQGRLMRNMRSHLLAAGIPELIARDLKDYSRKAIQYANAADRLQQLRSKLERQRLNAPLFNASLFVRNLESAFEMIWERYLKGMAPAHVDVRCSSACTTMTPHGIGGPQ